MKAIFKKIAGKNDQRMEINHVLMTGDKLASTNSYTLIEVDQKCFEKAEAGRLEILRNRMGDEGHDSILVKPDELDLEEKILETMPISTGGSFPDYKPLIPSENALADDYTSMTINPVLLANVAEAVGKTFKNKAYREVTIHIPKVEGKPFIIRRKDGSAVGLVMPLK